MLYTMYVYICFQSPSLKLFLCVCVSQFSPLRIIFAYISMHFLNSQLKCNTYINSHTVIVVDLVYFPF